MGLHQQLHPPQSVADDPRVRAVGGRSGVAGATVLVAAEPVVQPVRGGPVRAHVQGAGPEPVLAGGLGTEHHLLQGSQGECQRVLDRVVGVAGGDQLGYSGRDAVQM